MESKNNPVKVELHVDGSRVPLNSFAERMVGGSVLGMLKALRGVEEPKEAELKLWITEEK